MWGASLHPCQLKVNINDSKPLGCVPFHPHPLTPSAFPLALIPPSPPLKGGNNLKGGEERVEEREVKEGEP